MSHGPHNKDACAQCCYWQTGLRTFDSCQMYLWHKIRLVDNQGQQNCFDNNSWMEPWCILKTVHFVKKCMFFWMEWCSIILSTYQTQFLEKKPESPNRLHLIMEAAIFPKWPSYPVSMRSRTNLPWRKWRSQKKSMRWVKNVWFYMVYVSQI